MRASTTETAPVGLTPSGGIRLICNYKPQHGEPIMGPCPACLHLLALHVGEDECPVCRLVRSPAMRPDSIIDAVRASISVLEPGQTLLVRVAPYMRPEQVADYQKRITSLIERAGLPNAVLLLYGEEFATMAGLPQDVEGAEEHDEQGETSEAEGEPETGRGALGPGSPADEGGQEAPGTLPAGELPAVPAEQPAPDGSGEGRGTADGDGAGPEELEAASAADGQEPAAADAGAEAEGNSPVEAATRRRRR